MASVGIIGGGAFGTAMACVISRSGHDVLVWAREPEVVAAINADAANPLFLSGVALPRAIKATGDLAAAAEGRDFMLVAVPAQHLRGVTGQLRRFVRRDMPVATCSKGIERGSCALMPEVIAETLPQSTIAVLSGPSFAREIALDLPCGVVLACGDAGIRDALSRAIANPRFCVHPSADVIGAAVGGVMKNVIAIASGIAAGRKLGENARSTLVTYGLGEAIRLGLAKGAKRATFMGLAGIGDLMLTANSLQSRNTSLGVALGEGRKLADVLAGRREVTEGVFSVEALAAMAGRLGLEMPITETLDQVLNHSADLVHQPLPRLPSLALSADEISRYYEQEGNSALAWTKSLLDRAGIAYTAHILVGPVAQTIVELGTQTGADLILLGTRGIGLAGNPLLGSTATKVLYFSTIPVLVVKCPASF